MPPHAWVESRYTYAHDPASRGLPGYGTLSGGPTRERSAPRLCEYGPIGLCVVASGRRQRDTCNSNGNATGSDRCPTWVLLRCALIKPPGENSTPGSLKAVLVSLVKPVAYLKY